MTIPRSLTSPDPRARRAATVTHGRVRITVLTSRLLRLEYATDGRFEDRGSMTVVNRRLPVPRFESSTEADHLVVDTGDVVLDVSDTSRPFSARTLSARIGHGRRAVTWRHGDRPRTNLGGTMRTLDNCRGREVRELVDIDEHGELVFGAWHRWDLEPGLLSRDGWVLVDDSATPVLDPSRGRPDPARGRGWPTTRPPGHRRDLYLFAYGTDHRGALRAAADVIGPQPLPPRYAFGYWCSRYHAYTDRELLEVVEQFDHMDVPIDVMVLDMDWHLPGWTGYTWDRRYFPDPTDTIDRLHGAGLHVALNLHPADGIGRHEDAYPAMCVELGIDPTEGRPIPFDAADPRFVDASFRHLHHPEEDRGVDFWWMDWQQGTDTSVAGLDPLPWLNELCWADQAAHHPQRRPLVFSRWGGLGGGRTPIGFSGDTWSTWDSLALQPWFTATAANVGYGYWSHDVGGHYGPPPDPELYTRWVQFGAHSPVLRTHATKHPAQERRFWEFPDPYRSAMCQAIRRRYEMVPYLYGQSRDAVTTGVSALRPMYVDHPDADAAYQAEGQYHLGDSLVVAPVVRPTDDDAMAAARVWLPRGRWFDTALGQTIDVRSGAGRWLDRRYLIDEVPVFAVAGSVRPGQQRARRLNAACSPVPTVAAYPGDDGDGELYEDDGVSTGYLHGRSVRIGLHHRIAASTRTVRMDPAIGDYPGWERHRPVEVRFVAEAVPASVEVDGHDVSLAAPGHVDRTADRRPTWSYDAASASVVVWLPRVDLRSRTTVRLRRDRTPSARAIKAIDGFPGLARRLDEVSRLVRQVSPPYELHPEERLAAEVAQAAHRASADPTTALAEMQRARAALGHLAVVLAELEDAWRHAVALVWADQRGLSVATIEQARRILDTTRDQFG